MSQYRLYGARDDQESPNGDASFAGVDARQDPRSVPERSACGAVNKDFETGSAETRRGIGTMPWTANWGVDFPLTFGHGTLNVASPLANAYRSGNILTYVDPSHLPATWPWVGTQGQALTYGFVFWCIELSASDHQEFTIGQNVCVSGFAYAGFNRSYRIGDFYAYRNGGQWEYAIWCEVTWAEYLASPINEEDVGCLIEEAQLDFHQCGFGKVFGAGKFSDPYGSEGQLVANKHGVWRLRPNCEAELIPLPNHEKISAKVKPIQAFDRVILLRGEDLSPLEWNPRDSMEEGTNAFAAIAKTAVRGDDDDNTFGDGTTEIPPATEGIAFGNRILLVQGRDEIIVSDILDYTRYNAITQRFRINSGSSDKIVALAPWTETSVIVFKDQSVHVLGECWGSLANAYAKQLTGQFGLVGVNAWAPAGKDIWFLSSGGVRSLALTDQNELQAIAEPISKPIQGLINRINWPYASGAAAGSHENKFYLAVPLDGADHNNAILVYDFLTQMWAGYWTADWMDVSWIMGAKYMGQERLFVIQGDGSDEAVSEGAVAMMGTDWMDQLYGEEYEIEDELLTRGYVAPGLEGKVFPRLICDQSTWRPKVSVSVVVDGQAEEYTLKTDMTKDRTKYYRWAHEDFDETNTNDDFLDPYRQDYSVVLDESLSEGIYCGTHGINPNLLQRVQEVFHVGRRGLVLQVRIRNTQGRLAVHGVQLDVRRGQGGKGRKS